MRTADPHGLVCLRRTTREREKTDLQSHLPPGWKPVIAAQHWPYRHRPCASLPDRRRPSGAARRLPSKEPTTGKVKRECPRPGLRGGAGVRSASKKKSTPPPLRKVPHQVPLYRPRVPPGESSGSEGLPGYSPNVPEEPRVSNPRPNPGLTSPATHRHRHRHRHRHCPSPPPPAP